MTSTIKSENNIEIEWRTHHRDEGEKKNYISEHLLKILEKKLQFLFIEFEYFLYSNVFDDCFVIEGFSFCCNILAWKNYSVKLFIENRREKNGKYYTHIQITKNVIYEYPFSFFFFL